MGPSRGDGRQWAGRRGNKRLVAAAAAMVLIVGAGCSSPKSSAKTAASTTLCRKRRRDAVYVRRSSTTPRGYDARATLTGPVYHRPHRRAAVGAPARAGRQRLREHEYFASGTAMAFEAACHTERRAVDGQPTTSAAPYKTRIIVRRPTDPARFNGTVIVEWMNVSAGESSPDWDYLNPADAGRLRLRGRLRPGAGRERWNGRSSALPRRVDGLVHLEPTRYGHPASPRGPVRAGHVRPDRPGAPVPSGGRLGGLRPGTSWPPASPSRPST